MLASAVGTDARGSRSVAVLRRFSGPTRRPAFWIALWAAIAARRDCVALASIVFADEPVPGYRALFRLVGGAFVGLRADRLAPAARTAAAGPLMVATGFGLLVEPVVRPVRVADDPGCSATCSRTRGASRRSRSCSASSSGGRVEGRPRDARARRRDRPADWSPSSSGTCSSSATGTSCSSAPTPAIADALARDLRAAERVRVPRHGGRDRRALQARVAAAAAGDAAERGRDLVPAAVRRGRNVGGLGAAGVARGLLAAGHAGGVPGRPAALAAGARRRRRPVRRAAHDARRRAAGAAGEGRPAIRASSSPTGSPTRTPTPTRTARRSRAAGRRPVASRAARRRRAGLRRGARRGPGR